MISSYDNISEQEQEHWRWQVEQELETCEREIQHLTVEINELFPLVVDSYGTEDQGELTGQMSALETELEKLRVTKRSILAELEALK